MPQSLCTGSACGCVCGWVDTNHRVEKQHSVQDTLLGEVRPLLPTGQGSARVKVAFMLPTILREDLIDDIDSECVRTPGLSQSAAWLHPV